MRGRGRSISEARGRGLSSGGAAADPTGPGLLVGLVWSYNFNEASGDAVDEVGSLDLTANNSPGAEAASSPGGIGGARTTNGSTQYFSHVQNAAFNFFGADDADWTFDLFVKPGSGGIVLAKDSAAGREYTLVYDGSQFFTYNPQVTVLAAVPSTEVAASGSYHHVLVEYVGATKLMAIEVNGERDEVTLGGHPGHSPSPDTDFNVGRRAYAGFEDYIAMSVNSLCRWSRLLTPAEKAFRQAMLLEYPFS